MHVPQEIWDHITSYLPSTSTVDAAEAFPFRITSEQKAHGSLWRAIFKDESWLQIAVERYGVNPVLVGPDLRRFYRGRSRAKETGLSHLFSRLCTKPKRTYMVLVACDPDGTLCEERETFFKSLQRHECNQANERLLFANNIVLNIEQVVTSCDGITLADRRLMFEEKQLRTSYCFWRDPERQMRCLEAPDIIGTNGPIVQHSDVHPVFCFRMTLPRGDEGGEVQEQIFRNPFVPPLYSMYRGRLGVHGYG